MIEEPMIDEPTKAELDDYFMELELEGRDIDEDK